MRIIRIIRIAFGIFLLLLTVNASAREVGFSSGNEFKSIDLYGDLIVICNGAGRGSARTNCATNILDPNEYAYFVGPAGVDADYVILKATHADGSTRSKESGYDVKKGRSSGTFNLWITTVFQRQLLRMGENRIIYKMTKNGKVVVTGEFVANVTQGQDRECRSRTLWGNTENDCNFPENLCAQYFRSENYCQ